MPVTIDSALLAGILAAQLVQVGFEAKLLSKTSALEERVDNLRDRVRRELS